MPLTAKGSKIMAAMKKQYGSAEKAERVFYASANKGTITGVHPNKKKYARALKRKRRKKRA
jgi:hypothetical protein